MPITMNMNLHRIANLSIEPDYDEISNELRWVDLVITDEEGAKQEITLFTTDSNELPIQMQGDDLVYDNPLTQGADLVQQAATHPESVSQELQAATRSLAKVTQSFELPANDFTEKENLVLKALVLGLYAEPGFSDVEANELATETGLTVYAVGGVLSSLLEKGVISTDDSHGLDDVGALIYLCEGYYWLHPAWSKGSEPLMLTHPESFQCDECGITDQADVALCLADGCKHAA